MTKCKFQIAHKPQNRNHSEKNVSAERQYLHKSKHTHNTTKNQQESHRAYGTAERDSYVIVMLIPNMANVIV